MDTMETEEALGTEKDGQARERSTIVFPYVDLDDAVRVAKTLYERGGSASLSQLSSWLEHDTVKSGAFRIKLAGAKAFGLIRIDRDKVSLTDLGMRISDESSEKQARAEAFLRVPLYRKTFDKYDGFPLPADSGLESLFVNFGVAEKQKSRARQVFQRSARQAGYFDQSKGRLVAPHEIPGPQRTVISEAEKGAEVAPTAREAAPLNDKHPLIEALFSTVPAEGAPWDFDSREKWLSTAKSIFDLIYRE